jgi:hypothetical protein
MWEDDASRNGDVNYLAVEGLDLPCWKEVLGYRDQWGCGLE